MLTKQFLDHGVRNVVAIATTVAHASLVKSFEGRSEASAGTAAHHQQPFCNILLH